MLLYNEPMIKRTSPSHSRSFLWSIVLVLGGGGLFGALARLIIEAAPAATDAGSFLWLVNHLTSGTWLWAVAACASTWIGMRHSQRSGWRRYLQSFFLCLGFSGCNDHCLVWPSHSKYTTPLTRPHSPSTLRDTCCRHRCCGRFRKNPRTVRLTGALVFATGSSIGPSCGTATTS